jgi:hypothetical protein
MSLPTTALMHNAVGNVTKRQFWWTNKCTPAPNPKAWGALWGTAKINNNLPHQAVFSFLFFSFFFLTGGYPHLITLMQAYHKIFH